MKSLALIILILVCTVKAYSTPNDNDELKTAKKEKKKTETEAKPERNVNTVKRIRGLRANSFNLMGGGYPGYMGASVSSHITKRVEFQLGIGAISAFTGFKIYAIPPLPKKIAVNIGYNFGIITFTSSKGFYQYIPLEVKYYSRNNISFGFNAGYWIQDSVSSRFWGGASIGFRFGKQMGN